MTIWAIADIHASPLNAAGEPEKPMEIFGDEWADHVNRIERSWEQLVDDLDTVIVAGDFDWALYLNDALPTLHRIHRWKGRKILLRGNHDYWWSSKTTSKVRTALPGSIALIHNNSFQVDGVNICGAKGSPVPGGMDWSETDAKLLNRETERLKMSLATRAVTLPTIVALHYPPFYPASGESPYVDIMNLAAPACEPEQQTNESGVVACIYGHLHGDAAASGPQGRLNGIEYVCVAADSLGFAPIAIWKDGGVVARS